MKDAKSPGAGDANGDSDDLTPRSFAGAGIQFAVSLVIFLFGGQWVDRRFGTSPVFVLIGVLVGGGASFYSMYRRLVDAQKAHDERRRMK